MRDLNNTDGQTAKASGWTTLKGDPNRMVCVAKATFDDGDTKIMKSTKVVEVPGGCLVQSTTEHSKLGVAEALVFVPGATAVWLQICYGG